MALAGAGYFVLEANPRGQLWPGRSFMRAPRQGIFGLREFSRHPRGGRPSRSRSTTRPPRSYRLELRGFMTMWGVTQPTASKRHGRRRHRQWAQLLRRNKSTSGMIPFFGKSVYDEPGLSRKALRSIYQKNVKTPTLVIDWRQRGNVPRRSLRISARPQNGCVETQLVVFGTRRPYVRQAPSTNASASAARRLFDDPSSLSPAISKVIMLSKALLFGGSASNVLLESDTPFATCPVAVPSLAMTWEGSMGKFSRVGSSSSRAHHSSSSTNN